MEALHPDVKDILLGEDEIRDIVARMGAEISQDYADKNPLVVAVLRGAVVFMADLMRAIDCPIGPDRRGHPRLRAHAFLSHRPAQGPRPRLG